MATAELSQTSGSNRPPRTRTRRPRRGGHRNNGSAPADANTNATPNLTTQVPNGPLALRPASVAPLPDSNPPAPSNSRNSNANNRGGGNGRRGGFGRGGRRGGGRGQPMANGRVFGGQLTSNSHTDPTSDAGSFAGDAPAFTPGHPIATRPGPSRAPRARRMSKSQAADLATRTHEDITNGQYECAICTNEIRSTKADGLVGKSATMYFPEENITVSAPVMRASVAVARFLSNQHAIVVKSKKLYLARNAMKSVKVKHQPVRLIVKVWPRGHGLDLLTVALNAVDHLIAVNQNITCPRVCRATLNCGRHECGERCCSGEKKASERQAAKRKHRALNAPPTEENIEAEHICLKVCGLSAIVLDNAKTRLRHVINRAEDRKAFAITPVPTLAMPLTPKQAVKCLASKSSEGNSKKTLDCNDECLKLQRNAKLAAALNIDPSTHTDDHIPYSQQTLDMVKDMLKFCQTYEREFRVFAADPSEKRLRFKPMPSHQRAFLHSLAEDYGLDSESQDPEPHRHVSIFKTPRFVSAPLKTLAQCVKVKPVAVVEAASSKRLVATAEPFNAFLLSNPRFGLTIDEIHTDLSSEFANAGLNFDVSFLPSGEVVLRGKAPETWYTKVDSALTAMQHSLFQKVKALQLASTVVLCSVDSSLNVVRREDDHLGGGWSQVAKGASGSKAPVRPEIGVKSSFTVLGTRTAAKKKKEEQDSAVDDWEKEVEAWDA
ncbi:hypothetical protein BPOR_0037g00040 [Botrytis porri]|uniref:R3H domain-containing protein n=1 Tax=Botrytis porri TaxID=87229 RepID=A0A4Z1L2X7_9HELO|nr:hypothetical protein BPOR_0037g00040 [Botrytis porri]